jgi:membrane dipeptidase
MTLTHSSNIPWADSGTDVVKLGGLSKFGEEVVREMNWLGMLVDLSHTSPETMADAIGVTKAPVIFSHSSARTICDVPRNVPDNILGMLRQNGGVVMVTFVPGFLSNEVAAHGRAEQAERARLQKELADKTAIDAKVIDAKIGEWRRAHPAPQATLAQVADHIDHMRKVAGIDHIGLGSDFDGIDSTPVGLENVSTYPALTAELLKRGYSDDDIRKILGLNVLRVMRQTEKVAAQLQKERGPSPALISQIDGTP